MHNIIRIIVAFLALSSASIAAAAESYTISAVANTESEIGTGNPYSSFVVTKLAWKAAATGAKADVTLPAVKGYIRAVKTNPGSPAPADNYDLTLVDSDGLDVMGGEIMNRDTANTEIAVPKVGSAYMPVPVYGSLTAKFTAQATADCEGEIFIYYDPNYR